eukprot:522350_1
MRILVIVFLIVFWFCAQSAQTVDPYFTSLSSTYGNWQEAQEFCQSQGTELASIHSLDDWNAAKAQCEALLSAKLDSNDMIDGIIIFGCWIGLNNIDWSDYIPYGGSWSPDKIIWLWSDATPSDYGFTGNDPSQPTEGVDPWHIDEIPYLANMYVAAIMQTGQEYNYRWTLATARSYCYAYPICNGKPPPTITPTTGPTASTGQPTEHAVDLYFTSLASTWGTWQEAQEYCQSEGTTLASIHSLDDWNQAKAQCAALLVVKSDTSYGCWIGLNDIETQVEWVWSDGTPSDYGFANDDPTQPTEGVDPWHIDERPYAAMQYEAVILQKGDYYGYRWTLALARTYNYAYPLCNGKPPPTSEPTTAPITSTPTSAPTRETCTKNVNYVIDGTICKVWGDPHFNTWSGTRGRHDFMGQPAIGTSQFYYVARCNDVSVEDMPFTIIGKHKAVRNTAPTGLDYLTFELYDDDGTEYLLFLSTYIASYSTRDASVSTLYADQVQLTGIPSGVDTAIGNRFSIRFTKSTLKINAVLTIDGTCTVVFWMDGSWSGMHTLYIKPPVCYQCFICGLCGDFKRAAATSATQRLETCNGGFVEYVAGWGANNPFAYDINGNTWGVDYCSQRRRRLSGTFVEYIPDVGDHFTYVEPCDSSIAQQVVDSCQTARDNAATCCDSIGGNMCDELQESCEFDGCVVSGTNASVIDENVARLFTAAVDLACDIPNGTDLFDEARIIADTVIEEFEFPTEVPSTSPIVETDEPTAGPIETTVMMDDTVTVHADLTLTPESTASNLFVLFNTITCALVMIHL